MKLSEGKTNEQYIINKIEQDKRIKQRLQVLGVIKDTKIQILNKRTNALIIKVRGTRLGIDKQIANKIYITRIHEKERKTNEKLRNCLYRKS